MVHLTPREKDVLELLVKGLTNIEIASALHVSPHTIKAHVEAMMAKVDVNKRLLLAVWAVRQGLA